MPRLAVKRADRAEMGEPLRLELPRLMVAPPLTVRVAPLASQSNKDQVKKQPLWLFFASPEENIEKCVLFIKRQAISLAYL